MAATATAPKTAPRRSAPRKPPGNRAAPRTAAPRRSAPRKTTPRTAPRKATPRKAAPRRAPARSATTGWHVPVAAVGRSVGIVGRIADSAIVLRLTRGRLWIGLLGTLLVGIVGLNVVALSFSATASNTAREVDELKRLNSAARANLAGQLSSDELHHVATKLGLVVPAPNRIAYLKPSAKDAEIAAERIRSGELAGGAVEGAAVADVTLGTAETLDETTPVPASTDPATTDPAASGTTATATTDPATATDPAATAPAVTAPAATASAGGLAAP